MPGFSQLQPETCFGTALWGKRALGGRFRTHFSSCRNEPCVRRQDIESGSSPIPEGGTYAKPLPQSSLRCAAAVRTTSRFRKFDGSPATGTAIALRRGKHIRGWSNTFDITRITRSDKLKRLADQRFRYLPAVARLGEAAAGFFMRRPPCLRTVRFFIVAFRLAISTLVV